LARVRSERLRPFAADQHTSIFISASGEICEASRSRKPMPRSRRRSRRQITEKTAARGEIAIARPTLKRTVRSAESPSAM
jgi:hypothetical protein